MFARQRSDARPVGRVDLGGGETAVVEPVDERLGSRRVEVGGSDLNALFAATVEATEEAVVNALWAAPDVTGREGRVERGLPHDEVLELLREHGALA